MYTFVRIKNNKNMKKIIISIIVLVLIVGATMFFMGEAKNSELKDFSNSIQINSSASTTIITIEEVTKHNQKSDCWLVLDKDVLNVTAFVDKHPGGEVILQGCGKDATQMYNSVNEHMKPFVKALAERMVIGKLQN